MIEITDEERIELIKRAIKTEAGWQLLVQSIKTKQDKEHCISLLKKIAGEKMMDGEAIIAVTKQQYPDLENVKMDPQDFSLKLSDQLIQTLEEYMEKV